MPIKDFTYMNPQKLRNNGILNSTDLESSVNEINTYFANIGRTLAENILIPLETTYETSATHTCSNIFVMLETEMKWYVFS